MRDLLALQMIVLGASSLILLGALGLWGAVRVLRMLLPETKGGRNV